ncbi:MAG: VTT domain-containing protein [Pirellulales bacterium]|nr:VTT domain-containing protein [Pirellulales bacterium]
MDRRLVKPLLLVTIVLVLPAVLLAARGESFARWLVQWQTDPPAAPVLGAAVVAMLASDVVLPVPSGPLSTLAGSQLGVAWGAAASFAGMTLGAAIAFALARRWGTSLATRLSSPGQLADATEATRRHGPWLLAITRPLPILAEATALVVGALCMPWRQFLPPVMAANLAMALVYAALGQQAAERGWLPLAVAASVAIPLAAAVGWRRRLRRGANRGEAN